MTYSNEIDDLISKRISHELRVSFVPEKMLSKDSDIHTCYYQQAGNNKKVRTEIRAWCKNISFLYHQSHVHWYFLPCHMTCLYRPSCTTILRYTILGAWKQITFIRYIIPTFCSTTDPSFKFSSQNDNNYGTQT